jgi:hypothetical protein
VYEVGGRRFRGALLPTEIPASREPGLRLNPQLRRIPAEMRADLTSAEIAMSGSYFDDVLRDPRRYRIENTTDKVRRQGAVRRRRDAVCTGRMVGYSEKANVHWFPTDVLRVLRGPQGRLLLPAAPDCETFVRSVGELRSRGRVPQ